MSAARRLSGRHGRVAPAFFLAMEDATDFSKAGAFSAALCKYLVKQSPREYQRPSPLFRNLRCRRLVIYKLSMSDNVFDFETLPSLEGLVKHLGGLDECKRLGFVFEDERKVMSLSHAGMGYLCSVRAMNI